MSMDCQPSAHTASRFKIDHGTKSKQQGKNSLCHLLPLGPSRKWEIQFLDLADPVILFYEFRQQMNHVYQKSYFDAQKATDQL